MYMYICIYVYIYIYVYMYMYIYLQLLNGHFLVQNKLFSIRPFGTIK